MFFEVLLLCIVGLIPANAIHHHMTLEEQVAIFKTDNSNEIPEYEVVKTSVNTNSPLASVEVKLKAFGENITLYLNPTEGILAGYDTPIWKIKSGRYGPRLKRDKNVFKRVKFHLLEDSKTGASVVVEKKPDEGLNIRGFNFGNNLAIHDVPERLQYLLSPAKNTTEKIGFNNDIEDDNIKGDYHIVYKTPEPVNFNFSKSQFKTSPRSKRAVLDIVYPQILVVVDNEYFKKLGNNIAKALPYLLNFWNGVDLIYRGLESPKFRLNIAGFVFAKDNKALEYMSKNSLKQNFSDVGNALSNMSLFWYQRRWDIPLESYDVVTTMTGDELCSYGIATKENCTTLGQSFVGGACRVSTEYPLFLGVSIIKDNCGYKGIPIAAHELGHSFGVNHDDREHCSRGNKVNIMSTNRIDGASSSDWSDCSLKDFSKFLSSNVSVCLQNKPNSGKALPKYLPGKTMSADEQCKAMGYIEALQNGFEICESLKCVLRFEDVPVVENGSDYMLRKWWYTVEGVAAEGTTCDDKKICLHNQCIEEETTK